MSALSTTYNEKSIPTLNTLLVVYALKKDRVWFMVGASNFLTSPFCQASAMLTRRQLHGKIYSVGQDLHFLPIRK